MIPIKVKGKQYRSIAEAWREVSPKGLKLITVRLRLRNGWHVDEAFSEPWVSPQRRRNHHRTHVI